MQDGTMFSLRQLPNAGIPAGDRLEIRKICLQSEHFG